MGKRNYTELALRDRDALEQFARGHLGVGFEMAAEARYRRECLVRIFQRHGHIGFPYQAIKDCSKSQPCGLEACPWCARWTRIHDAYEYKHLLEGIGEDGATLFAASIVPKGSVLTAAQLAVYDVGKACARHAQAYRRHSKGFRSFLRVGIDVCYDRQKDLYRLHWHGVVAVWDEEGVGMKRLKKKVIKALRRAFYPLKKGRKLKIKPVVLRHIYDLACWLTYAQKALYSEGGMGRFKSQGTLLSGVAEIPIRVFLALIPHRRRFLEVNTHKEIY